MEPFRTAADHPDRRLIVAEPAVGNSPEARAGFVRRCRAVDAAYQYSMEVEALLDRGACQPRLRDNVRRHTPTRLNHRIDQAMMKRIMKYARMSPEAISRRINELDQEWDFERVVETGAGTMALTGVLMSGLRSRKWLVVSAASLGALLQHSLTRRSLPLRALRTFGVRTRREIESEKYALRILRGDFDNLTDVRDESHRAIEALRLSRP